ncbi:hypothetical protein SAMN02745217_01333 [Anaerocolumna xylanovorans DSM 12503]|uniref:Uncharacterized protein n=2 Tax=Anaerocolumna TaxID=1843210 RepID=A0A1M7Y478_9FIRM|nr:hypothetical protein SAMN02745217_01333 [Anaerocolumna xylanovorans DSM 12503]
MIRSRLHVWTIYLGEKILQKSSVMYFRRIGFGRYPSFHQFRYFYRKTRKLEKVGVKPWYLNDIYEDVNELLKTKIFLLPLNIFKLSIMIFKGVKILNIQKHRESKSEGRVFGS